MHPRSLLRQLTDRPLDKPCDTPWDETVGDDKVRRCASCDRDVYSLSDMGEVEAELRLLNAPDRLPCIRYQRDADGNLEHRLPLHVPHAVAARPGASARAFALASALGGTLVARSAAAKEKPADKAAATQCVMYENEPVTGGAAASPAPSSAPSAPRAAAASSARAGAPAAAPPSPSPERPPPMGGAPMPIQQRIAYGTLDIVSKVPRQVNVQGLVLNAPMKNFRMTPGAYVLEWTEPGKKRRTVRFTIAIDQPTEVNLDRASARAPRPDL